MSDSSEIIRAIRGIVGADSIDTCKIIQGTVTFVNDDNTINIKPVIGYGSADILNVEVSTSTDGMIKIPTIGSQVNILMSNYIHPFVVMAGDLSKYEIMGSEFFGLVKIKELTDIINDMQKTINDLSTKINQLQTGFNSHIHTATSSTGPTTPPTTPSSIVWPEQITLTVKEDYENPDIQHGAGVPNP